MAQGIQGKKLTIGSYDMSSLILLQCITPVHVGAGRGSSIVDLPVQKDAFGYPTIFSSSLKGAIRQGSEDEIYGSGDFAGAFTPLDAKMLFIPVRSLFGVYCLATCPFLLKSFKQYLNMCELKGKLKSLELLLSYVNDNIPKTTTNSVLIASKTGQKNFGISILDNNKQYAILADEFKLEIVTKEETESLAMELGIAGEGGEGEKENKWRLVIVSDDLMRNNLVKRSMITASRIKIEGGTAKQNALWTEESLPEKTILYSVFFYSKSRGKENLPSNEVQKRIENKIVGKYTMFGGHETIGRGITQIIKVI